jgi:drug/metabolite transporter (DMT)-like permease
MVSPYPVRATTSPGIRAFGNHQAETNWTPEAGELEVYEDLMPFSTLALLMLAALLHSGAHIALKRATDKLAFTWWQLLAIIVVYSPVLLTFQRNWPPAVWLIVTGSAVAEAAYFYATSRAYTLGDLSVTYPLARGSAPLFIALWAVLFLRERPSALGYAGIVVIALGLFLVNLPSLEDIVRPLRGLAQSASRWALTAGLCIGVYSTLDKVGVKFVSPLLYIYIILVVTWLVMTPGWWLDGKTNRLASEWRTNKWSAALAGVAVVGAYTLVLMAMQRSPVSYVGSVREMSVVLTAWVGSTFLGEGKTSLRVTASALVVAGILLIAVKG